jgi:hypothetical protein
MRQCSLIRSLARSLSRVRAQTAKARERAGDAIYLLHKDVAHYGLDVKARKAAAAPAPRAPLFRDEVLGEIKHRWNSLVLGALEAATEAADSLSQRLAEGRDGAAPTAPAGKDAGHEHRMPAPPAPPKPH